MTILCYVAVPFPEIGWERRSQVGIWMVERMARLDGPGPVAPGASPGLGLSTQQSGGWALGWSPEERAVLAECGAGWK